jgi:hypothetical protein
MPWETWVATRKKKRYVGKRMRYGNISQGRQNESARRAQKAMVLGVIFNVCGYYTMQYTRMGRILTLEDGGRRDAWDLLRGFDAKREVLSHGSESGQLRYCCLRGKIHSCVHR